jgi:hypothetical protein
MSPEDLKNVVRVVVAQHAPRHGYADIKEKQSLKSLGIKGESAILELKMGLYKAISGKKVTLDFPEFFGAIPVTVRSTLDELSNWVAMLLPGNNPTPVHGKPPGYNPIIAPGGRGRTGGTAPKAYISLAGDNPLAGDNTTEARGKKGRV